MNKIRIKLFGNPDVQVNGVHIDFSRRKCLALLAYLAVTGERHSRESLADLLWPETNSSRALANLRNVLYTLNHTHNMKFLDKDRKTISLSDHSVIQVDVNDFRQHLRSIMECSDNPANLCNNCLAHLKKAVSLYRDDFMTGFGIQNGIEYEQWQLLEAQALARDRQYVLQKLIDHLESSENWDMALNYARQLVDKDPLEESAHRRLMVILTKSGRPVEAIRQYEKCCEILQSDLNLEPDDETRELYTKIRNNELLLDLVTLDKSYAGCRLPTQTTSFIGRKKELAHLKKIITEKDYRIITITGHGGCGKTRLAHQTAAKVAASFENSVAWVSLAPVNSVDFIASTLAESLNMNIPKSMLSSVSQSDLTEMKDQLILHLQEKQIMIVLDNFEHLLDGAKIISQILDAAPHVQFLVTSRERLNLHGEWVYEITGLNFPSQTDRNAFEKTDAVRLFVQTAQQSSTVFAYSDKNKADIACICRMVQGSPLAIELSAAWARVLNCSEIIEEIKSSLDFLTSTQKNLPDRHRSIRAVFEQSWKLLIPEEQDCFKELAVMRGGFSRQAAFEVGKTNYRTLASLLDKSILQRTASDRFEIHEVLRQYAEERLQSEPNKYALVRERHAQHYLQFVRETERTIRGFNQKASVRLLLQDIENIRIAWLWAAKIQDFSSMLNAAPGLFLFYDVRNQFLEGFELFKQAYDRIEPFLDIKATNKQEETKTVLAGYLLGIMGWFLRFSTCSVTPAKTDGQPIEISKACEFMDRALQFIEPFTSRVEWAQIVSLSVYLKNKKLTDQTAVTLKKCHDIFEKHQDHWGTAMCLDGIGCSLGHHNDGRDEKYSEKALKIREKAGDRWGVAISYYILGTIEERNANLPKAKRYYHQSWTIRKEQGLDINGEIQSLANLADAEYQLKQYDIAFQHLKRCLSLSETMSNFYRTALIMGYIGERYYKMGELDQAADYLNQCISLSLKHGHADKFNAYAKILDKINQS